MVTAVAFALANALCCLAAIARGPLWGLFAYANIYFNSPNPNVNWWGASLPNLRWNLLVSAVIGVSALIHRDRLAANRMRPVLSTLAFFVLTLLVTLGLAVNREQANFYTYMLFTYVMVVFFLVKCIRNLDELRQFSLVVVALAASLSLKAVIEGERVHARLESIGPSDARSSNEFGLLLAAIVPLILPFLWKGRWHERAIGLAALILCLNAFVLCNSRGALLALVAGAGYGIFAAGRRMRRLLLVASLCGAAATFYLADEYFIERVSSLWRTDLDTEDALNTLSSGRLAIFGYGWAMAKDHPLGAGPNGFRELSRFYMPPELLTVRPGADYGVRAAHNSYLQVLVEQGVLGLAIFLSICWYAIRSLHKSLRKVQLADDPEDFLGLTLLGIGMSLVCTLVGSMFGAQVYYEFLWWQIALATVGASLTHAPLTVVPLAAPVAPRSHDLPPLGTTPPARAPEAAVKNAETSG